MDVEQHIGAATSLERMVPKLCTIINVGLLNNKKTAILTLAYGDKDEGLTIIERVAIDIDHMASLRDVINKVLKDANHVSPTQV